MLEMVVYVSLSGFVIALTAQWFHAVFQVASKNKALVRQHSSLKRLASDFRTDVVKGTNVVIQSSRQVTVLDSSGETIVYHIGEGKIDRTVKQANLRLRSESYRDLSGLRLAFAEEIPIVGDGAESGDGVTLTVLQPAGKESVAVEKKIMQVRCWANRRENSAIMEALP